MEKSERMREEKLISNGLTLKKYFLDTFAVQSKTLFKLRTDYPTNKKMVGSCIKFSTTKEINHKVCF